MSLPSSSSAKRKSQPDDILEESPSKRPRIESLTEGALECQNKKERAHKKEIADLKRAYHQEIQAPKDDHKQTLQKLRHSPETENLRVELIDERQVTLDWQNKNCELVRQLRDANAELKALRNENYHLRKEASDSNSLASKITKLETDLAHANIIRESLLSTQKTKYKKQIAQLGADLDQAREESATAKHEKRVHRKKADNQFAEFKIELMEKLE